MTEFSGLAEHVHQCRAAGVPFFGKQNFKKLPLPDDLMVREFPG